MKDSSNQQVTSLRCSSLALVRACTSLDHRSSQAAFASNGFVFIANRKKWG
ncbi:hypothetical protein ACFLQR_00610 [Verrucomicrobiota bacterium]